jgi:hypothetical protein
MGDTPSWGGGKLGPYHLGKRYRDTGADLGRLYEAHNVETGGRALVLTPGRSNEWRPRAGWAVRATGGAFPPFLALEVEHAPRDEASALQELTLMFHRLAGALARVEHRPDARAHLTREPVPRPLARQATRRHWLLIGAGGLTAVVLLVALWLRSPEPSGPKHAGGLAQVALDEPSAWVDLHEASPMPISYPLPEGPFKGQMKPPCHPAAVELRGGCWVTMEQRAPCPKGSAEHEGKCYVPVREKTPEPRSLQP